MAMNKQQKKTDSNVQGVEDYLAKLPDETRTALEHIRRTIKEAAPDAIETISYQVAAFKFHGMLVCFGATRNHCSFYVCSPSLMPSFKDELEGYHVSGATIHFSPEKLLPAELVKKIVKARIEENEARIGKR